MCTNLISISEKIGKLGLETLAKQTGFIKSKPQKISPTDFVLSFMQCIGQLSISLSDWANQLMTISNTSVSKQAIDQRTAGPRHVAFAASILQASLSEQLSQTIPSDDTALLASFNRVLVQDSSCVQLPRCLSTWFKGAHSKTDRPTASARIQLTADLKTEEVIQVDLKGYRDNDQSYSSEIIGLLKANDLVLRDQGYFVLDAFDEIEQSNAFFLSRLKPNVKVYIPQFEESIDLLKYCRSKDRKGHRTFEIQVEIGQKHRLPVRLMVQKLPQNTYQQRRRQAMKDRHQKANHSDQYLALLQWQLLITNAPQDWLPLKAAYPIYRLRWHIEILFKCWKSHFHLQKVMMAQKQIKVSRAQIMIYLYLAYLTLMLMGPYMYLARLIFQATGKLLSITKWAKMIAYDLIDYNQILTENWILHLARAATYEPRTDKENHLYLMWQHQIT